MKLRLATTWQERIGLVLTGLCGVWMWILMHQLSLNRDIEYSVSWISGVTTPAIWLFWFALVLFHIGLMFLITRSVVKDKKKDLFDGIVGMIATVGVFFLISAIISNIYFGYGPVEWMFNISQILLFRTGFIMEVIALLYFAFTE